MQAPPSGHSVPAGTVHGPASSSCRLGVDHRQPTAGRAYREVVDLWPAVLVNTNPQRLVSAVTEFGSEVARLLPERGMSLRQAVSHVGTATLERIEQAVDTLAVAYPGTPPADLLARVRRHLGYVSQLLDARKTLDEHRRLLVAGGWLSLLAATCAIDLRWWDAASARLRTAAQLARETGHAEMAAWCLETRAWHLLTIGNYPAAAGLARDAQSAAPRGSSAHIQATAQEGRALARLGDSARSGSYAALSRVEVLVSPMPMPSQPEHHYRYDPAKSEAYAATTLSWLADPAGEHVARLVLERLESSIDGPPRPRRAASARIDLSLALLAADKPDEAAGVALHAVTSGRLVPSNYWRAREVVQAVAEAGPAEAAELADAYREFCTPSAGRRELPGLLG